MCEHVPETLLGSGKYFTLEKWTLVILLLT